MTSETDLLKADRRALHFIAECAWREKKTIEYLCEAARDFGCGIFKTESCVALFFDFGKSSTVAFRAEMDALPLSERTGLSFAAKTICMRADMTDTWLSLWRLRESSEKRFEFSRQLTYRF